MNSTRTSSRSIVNRSFRITPPDDSKVKSAKRMFVAANRESNKTNSPKQHLDEKKDPNSETSTIKRSSIHDSAYLSTPRRQTRRQKLNQQVLDPFAIKISVPPLVLLTYVVFRWYFGTDVPTQRIRDAEIRHSQLMTEINDEIASSKALKNLSDV